MTSFLANSRPVLTRIRARTDREREKQLAQDAVAVLRNIIKLIRHILRPSGGAAKTLRNLCPSAAAWAIDTFESSTELLHEGNSLPWEVPTATSSSSLPSDRTFLFASKTMATLRIRRTSRKQVVERAANLLFLSLSSVFLPRHWRIIVKSGCQVLTVTSRINNPVGENVFYGN